jgi:hypothetical protein
MYISSPAIQSNIEITLSSRKGAGCLTCFNLLHLKKCEIRILTDFVCSDSSVSFASVCITYKVLRDRR